MSQRIAILLAEMLVPNFDHCFVRQAILIILVNKGYPCYKVTHDEYFQDKGTF